MAGEKSRGAPKRQGKKPKAAAIAKAAKKAAAKKTPGKRTAAKRYRVASLLDQPLGREQTERAKRKRFLGL